MFFDCSYSSEVWKYLTKGILKRSYSPQWLEVKMIVSENTMAMEKGYCVRYAMQSVIHTLWRERNKRKHGEPHTHVHVFKKIAEKNKLSLNSKNGPKKELFPFGLAVESRSRCGKKTVFIIFWQISTKKKLVANRYFHN
ncbi:hypothetical protein Bca4012_005332 [Brassica carinata]